MSSTQDSASTRGAQDPDEKPSNPIAALITFVRQVVTEPRKVVVPTRRELAGYTVTVLGFVFVMIFIVFGLDAGFHWLSRLVFTSGGA